MTKVEEFMMLAWDFANAWRMGTCATEASTYERALRAALTATLEAKDARIAELEQRLAESYEAHDLAVESVNETFNDDRRRFVDECAMRLYVMGLRLWVEKQEAYSMADQARWAYDAAEALATERDRRMT